MYMCCNATHKEDKKECSGKRWRVEQDRVESGIPKKDSYVILSYVTFFLLEQVSKSISTSPPLLTLNEKKPAVFEML
jgi:hypothetical protein